MYSNCCNHINPTSFAAGQVFQHRPLFNYNNVDPSLSHFPSPPCDEEAVNELTWQQLYDLFFQQQTNLITTADHHHHQNQTAVISNNMAADLKKEEGANTVHTILSSRKRSSKKDRHSKINTAHGPRDRRMRLSLEVARKFFDLQDMLGFDKASKTVEWLLIQSSSAIKEVMGIMPSTSEGDEGVSGIDDSNTTTTTENQHRQPSFTKKVNANVKSSTNKEKKAKQARRRTTAFHDRFARESRKIARERAKKRTMEKKRLGGDESIRSSFGESAGNQEAPKIITHHSSSYDQLGLQTEVEELSSGDQQLLETIEYAPHDDSLVITADWNTSTFCNFQQNPECPHEHHFTDFDRSLLY